MPCYHPIRMKQLERLNSKGNRSIVSYTHPAKGKNIDLPCGRCHGCRLERSRQWAVRCCAEMQGWKSNSFINLTYADDALVYGSSERPILVPRDLTLFWKRMRKELSKHGKTFRYFACGEYGELNHRPHYHAIIFGYDFPDKTYETTKNGNHYYHSNLLDYLWGNGRCIIGNASFESASYVARYVMKKRLGNTKGTYEKDGITPEFVVMSRRPGIGADYYDDFESDMFPRDQIFTRNTVATPPRYFTERYKKSHPLESEDLIARRVERAQKNWENNQPKRLRVRERIKQSATKSLIRDL